MREHIEEVDVHLGRFAPYHEGHKMVTEHLMSKRRSRRPLVIVGSSNVFEGRPPRDSKERELMLRTPYTAHQREEMIRRLFGETVDVLHLPDTEIDPIKHATSSSAWLEEISRIEAARHAKFVFAGGDEKDMKTLKKAFPVEVPIDRGSRGRGINATHIRNLIQSGEVAALREVMDPRVVPLAVEYFRQNIEIIRGLGA